MAAITRERYVTRTDLARIVLGWAAFGLLLIAHPLLDPPVPAPLLILSLGAIVGVIVVCAFGVVTQAEALAHRLGDPYGSLVLTLSIVVIEVVLISAVMLGPGENTTIARDSVMAVAMIILNLVIGLALVVGGWRHRVLKPNSAGASAYLSMLVVLLVVALVLPAVIGRSGAYTAGQAIPVVLLTLSVYAVFLARQTGVQSGDFTEVRTPLPTDDAIVAPPVVSERVTRVISRHRREVATRLVVLIATMIPIVLLSHDMAGLLDDGVGRIGAPTALVGVLIALIVFLPESLTALRAAAAGEIQRVSNLCHGALVSTVGLTIPAVLVIGLATGQTVVLGETPVHLVMIAVTLLLSVTTFAAQRVTAIHGVAHLAVFAVYALVLFS